MLVRVGKEYYDIGELVADGAVSPKEACRFLGVSLATVYRMMESGELPYSMVRGSRRIPRRALVEYLAQRLRGRRGA